MNLTGNSIMFLSADNENLIKTFIDELLKWNRGMNLIGKSTERDIWEKHIDDSLELYPYLEKDDCSSVIDVGSGGGIPAVPLSILLPKKRFYLTEVDSKKLAFLEFVTKKLILNTEVVDINGGFYFDGKSVIISRAYSSVKNIMDWAGLHAPGRQAFYLLKGREDSLKLELKDARVSEYELVKLGKGTLLIINFNKVLI
jgi:16S rRNA (guanine527-N7)-methyltransferase